MNERSQIREPTIYHYKLVRKLNLRTERKYSYFASGLVAIAAMGLLYDWIGAVYSALSLLLMLAIHTGVLWLTLRRVDEPSMKRWTFRRDWPWIGPLPIRDTTLSLFRRLHFHLFLVGCCAAVLLYPWAHPSVVVSLLYWHVWLLAPRVSLLWAMRRELGDGVLRLDSREVFYYHR